MAAFATKFPDAKGELIVQDLPKVVDEAAATDLAQLGRIEFMPHDFFSEQPIKGARIYFLHFIMHDWSETDCVRILTRLRDAMESGYSRIMINDMVLPDTKASLMMTAFDITMMCHHQAMERSESMWQDLIAKVDGLKLVECWKRTDTEGIIECVKE